MRTIGGTTSAAVGLAAVLLSAVVGAGPAAAQAVPVRYAISPTSGPPGTQLTFSGTGCPPSRVGPGGSDGAFALVTLPDGNFSGQTQAAFRSAANGSFTGRITVPASVRLGVLDTAVSCYGGESAGFDRTVTFTVTARTAPPPVAPPSTPPPATGGPLLAVGSTAVAYGASRVVTVTGGAPAARVELFAATLPSTTHKVIRSAALDAQGSASWSLSPGGHTSLYAVVDGVRSETATLRVARSVTLGVRQAAGLYRFSGVVDRPAAGLQVTLARVLSTGQVVGVGSTRTNAAGGYALTARLSPGTNLYYVLTAPTADLLAGRSRAYGLTVPRTTRR